MFMIALKQNKWTVITEIEWLFSRKTKKLVFFSKTDFVYMSETLTDMSRSSNFATSKIKKI